MTGKIKVVAIAVICTIMLAGCLSLNEGDKDAVYCTSDKLTTTSIDEKTIAVSCESTTTTSEEPTTTTTEEPTTTTTSTVPPAGCAFTTGQEACWETQTGAQNTRAELQHITGAVYLTTPGQVYENKWVEGCIAVMANNVTVRNVIIDNTGPVCQGLGSAHSAALLAAGDGTTNALFEHVTVDGKNTLGGSAGGPEACVTFGNYTADALNVKGCPKVMWAGKNVVIKNSYIHDTSRAALAAGDHGDGIDLDSGSNITIIGNYIADHTVTSDTGAIFAGSSWGPGDTYTIKGNYLRGDNGFAFEGGNNWSGRKEFSGNFIDVAHTKTPPFLYIGSNTIWFGNINLTTGQEMPALDYWN